MKKTVVIIISIVVALCLALAGLSALLKNEPESLTTTTTGAPTSTTSGTITTSSTTSTTSIPQNKTVSILELINIDEIDYIECFYIHQSSSSIYGDGLVEIKNIETFLESYVFILDNVNLVSKVMDKETYASKNEELNNYQNPPHESPLEMYCLVIRIFYGSNFAEIGLYHNNMIFASIPNGDTKRFDYYISVDYGDFDLVKIVEKLYGVE